MQELAIKVENLTKIYKLYDKPIDRLKESLHITKKKYHREHYALKNINFEVNKGETIGIIGTNGSGKSTLLKIITGVLSATSGMVHLEGRVSALLELGAGFNPEYTGVENVYLNGTMMGYNKEQMLEKMDDIISFADIGEFINQPVKTYSSGMFARLAFSVAINVNPDILIVDEALSVGDVFFQNKCFRKFDELQKRGTTILFVSHDIYSIKQMCSKVLWLDKGEPVIFSDKTTVCSMYINEKLKEMNRNNKINKNKLSYRLNDSESKQKRVYPKLKFNGECIQNEDVEIISFYIIDKDNNKTTELTTLSQYTITIVAKFNNDIENIIFGYSLESNKGIPVIGMNTFINDSERTFDIKEDQIIECSFEFVLPRIMKGEYLISPAIAQGDQNTHKTLVWMHNCEKITIINDGYNISMIHLDSDVKIIALNKDEVILENT